MNGAYEYELRVRYAETDQMGVVYYANYLIYMEAARSELLINKGLPYSQLESQGIYLPVKEVHCEYITSAHYEDVLIIKVTVAQMKGASIRIEYEIIRKEDNELIAVGYTIHPFVSKDGKLIRVPDSIRQCFEVEAKERG